MKNMITTIMITNHMEIIAITITTDTTTITEHPMNKFSDEQPKK